jgi:uncharacterized SAM-dependent methyltransferase
LRPGYPDDGGRRFEFAEGEAIHTEDSPKYTPECFAALVGRLGWRLGAQWRDADDLFMLAWLRAPWAYFPLGL